MNHSWSTDSAPGAAQRLIARLRACLVDLEINAVLDRGSVVARAQPDDLATLLGRLRDEAELHFDRLVDLTAVDGAERSDGRLRFDLVYRFHSTRHGHRLRLEVAVSESHPAVETASVIWPAAEWLEREVYDLFGLRFERHPDLRRILLDPRFEGHPLRKDFPVRPANAAGSTGSTGPTGPSGRVRA